MTILFHHSFLQQLRHLRGQQFDPFVQPLGPYVCDWVGTNDIGESRYTHQPGVGLRCVDEHAGNDCCRGDALSLQGDSVVQTARRAAPSIADSSDDKVGMAVQLRHHLRLGWKGSAVLLDVEDIRELEFVIENFADGPEDHV